VLIKQKATPLLSAAPTHSNNKMGAAGSVSGQQHPPAPDGKEQLVKVARGVAKRSEGNIVVTDAKDGMILHCNKGWEELCGYTSKEVVGHTNAVLQGSATDREAASLFTDKLRKGDANAQATLWNYKKDGSGFWNRVTVELVTTPTGDLHVGYLERMTVAEWGLGCPTLCPGQ